MTKNRLLAIIAMVFTTMIWGMTFEMVQRALSDAPPFIFATLRFGIGFVLGILYLNKKVFNITGIEFKGGIWCGIILCMGYAFQNFGLWEESLVYIGSNSSTSAFITSVSVILVPTFLYISGLQKISNQIWGIVVLAMIGLFVLLNPFRSNIVGGDIITFGCAISFAIHIILQDIYLKKGVNLVRFFMIQVFFVSLFSFICSLLFEGTSVLVSDIFTSEVLFALFITGVLATFVAFILMLWAQKILSATETGILLSLEPLFAALFSVFFAGDSLGWWDWIGGIIIILSVMSSGFLLSPRRK
jgi:drug/metabolite transporter (DMT)-like permease